MSAGQSDWSREISLAKDDLIESARRLARLSFPVTPDEWSAAVRLVIEAANVLEGLEELDRIDREASK